MGEESENSQPSNSRGSVQADIFRSRSARSRGQRSVQRGIFFSQLKRQIAPRLPDGNARARVWTSRAVNTAASPNPSTFDARPPTRCTRKNGNAWSELAAFLDYDAESCGPFAARKPLNPLTPATARDPGQGPLPNRAGSPEMSLAGNPGIVNFTARAGHDGQHGGTGSGCLRHHLRRTNQPSADPGSIALIDAPAVRSLLVMLP